MTGVAVMHSLPTAAVAFVALLDTASAIAADPAAIREQAAQVNELKRLLTADDPAVRVSAFQNMADSQDRAVRKMAIDNGIVSEDPTLQGLALRYIIGDMNTIVIDHDNEALKGDALKTFVNKYGHRYAIKIDTFDYGSGKFEGSSVLAWGGNPYKLTGQIAGTALQFSSANCSGNYHFNPETRAAFTGAMSCENHPTIQGGFRVR
jgi:hypothetical protein